MLKQVGKMVCIPNWRRCATTKRCKCAGKIYFDMKIQRKMKIEKSKISTIVQNEVYLEVKYLR